MTWAQGGLPNQPQNTPTCNPEKWFRNSASAGSAASAPSVTISGRRRPCSSRCRATCLRAPGPNRIGGGKENPCGGSIDGAPRQTISRYRFNSQSVTPSSHWRHSHSRVAAKCSTKASPSQSCATRECCRTRVVSIKVRGAQFEPLFHAVQTGGNHRSQRQIGIDIGARAAGLQPGGLGAAGNHAEAGRAVVHAPTGFDRRPKAIDQALVAVDGGPEQRREFHQKADLASQVAFKQRTHLAL